MPIVSDIVVGLAVLIGYGIHRCIPMSGFPLFPLCMVGGVILSLFAKVARIDLLVDRVQMERISGAALDFLVVSAVATIRLDVVAAHWQPLVILCVAGAVWSVACVLFVAPARSSRRADAAPGGRTATAPATTAPSPTRSTRSRRLSAPRSVAPKARRGQPTDGRTAQNVTSESSQQHRKTFSISFASIGRGLQPVQASPIAFSAICAAFASNSSAPTIAG